MKDITKQNFMYCMRAKEGKGCLCAAMFYIYETDDSQLQVEFKSLTDKYSVGTRERWKVPMANEDALKGFYMTHKRSIEFFETNFPNALWWVKDQKFDDESLIVRMPTWTNRTPPEGCSSEFWEKQYLITEEMFSKGYLNGNYPQGHYQMKDGQLVLLLSYFAAPTNQLLDPYFVLSLKSCHKLSNENPKKNWFVKHAVRAEGVLENMTSDDFWRLSIASQLYSDNEHFDTYLKKFLALLGPSPVPQWQEYIDNVLSGNYAQYEINETEVPEYIPLVRS